MTMAPGPARVGTYGGGGVPSVGSSLSRGTKRVIDVVGACVGLVVCAPVLAVAAIAIWRAMGHPIFYSQERPGLHGQPFRLHKLRTMVDAVRADGSRVTDYDRVTALGRVLRKTSIDEIPQLWNVLMGEMSLVGPRPLLPEYLDRYSPEQRRRHDVRPGVTGWSQIQRHRIDGWAEQFALDVWYVDHRTVRLDLEILVRTVVHVLRGGHAGSAMDSLSRTADREKEFRG